MFNLYYNAFNKELMNIILLGYMGVGKSLIGRHLSNILNQKFIDLDEYIENMQMTYSSVWDKKHENYNQLSRLFE